MPSTKSIYLPFIAGHFESRNRKINPENIGKVYDLFKGHTFYIQKTFNESFADTPTGEECTLGTIRTAIDSMIAYNDTIFREILSNIPEKQKELLYAIAKEGDAKQILSGEFIKRYSLTTSSSIQAATKQLLEKDLITETNKVYSVTDKLFAMWINQVYGYNLPLTLVVGKSTLYRIGNDRRGGAIVGPPPPPPPRLSNTVSRRISYMIPPTSSPNLVFEFPTRK